MNKLHHESGIARGMRDSGIARVMHDADSSFARGCIKLCIGQALLLFAVVFVCGVNFLNFFIWNQERERELHI